MKKSIISKWALALTLAGAGISAVFYYFHSMPAAEVVRKLSSLRVALELYRHDKGRLPASYSEVAANGNLEAVPALKLRGHEGVSSVKDVPAFKITDSGSWSYVSDPKSPDFGLVFIDCSHKDEKGRAWNEF